jgi:hypothetical protein
MPVIPTFGRQEEDCKFEANLGYMARPCLKANKKEFTSFVLEDLLLCANSGMQLT